MQLRVLDSPVATLGAWYHLDSTWLTEDSAEGLGLGPCVVMRSLQAGVEIDLDRNVG